MNRLYKDNIVPAYPTGIWSWDEKNNKIHFHHWDSEVVPQDYEVKSSSGYNFKTSINQMEEVIFLQEFTRSERSRDSDVIIIQDLKNLVLFLAPSEILTKKLISFLHTKAVDWFLNALIIYFEYFIRFVEFILVRRDDCSGKRAQLESTEATEIKRVFSEYLSQYRIILAREYSVILTGNGEMKPFYHVTPVTNISKTMSDRHFHESFLAISTQIVWIAHHRRGYEIIDTEMNRLFRSNHFKLNRRDAIEFSIVEEQLLYGENFKNVNCRYQNSPVIQELSSIRPRNLPVLWIGQKKYRGNDIRLQQLEYEIIIPDAQLHQVDITHGILGHPKSLYTTMLSLHWSKVREQKYSEMYDPYRLARQPYLQIPSLDTLKIKREQFETYFILKDNRYEYSTELIRKWKKRDKIIDYIMSGGVVIDVITKCRNEVAGIQKRCRPSSMQTTAEFLAFRQKLLKK